jgi:hypothetical protein
MTRVIIPVKDGKGEWIATRNHPGEAWDVTHPQGHFQYFGNTQQVKTLMLNIQYLQNKHDAEK